MEDPSKFSGKNYVVLASRNLELPPQANLKGGVVDS